MFFATEKKNIKQERKNIRLSSDFSRTEFNAKKSRDTFRVQKNKVNLIIIFPTFRKKIDMPQKQITQRRILFLKEYDLIMN